MLLTMMPPKVLVPVPLITMPLESQINSGTVAARKERKSRRDRTTTALLAILRTHCDSVTAVY